MAVKTFDEVVGTLQLSADEKKIFDSVLAKSPELKDGWLRQDDYSRKQNELKTEREKFNDDLEYSQRMKAWAETAVPVYDKLKAAGIVDDDGNEIWTEQKSKLEQQIEEARKQAVGGDMKPEELDKEVRRIIKDTGMTLSKEEIAAVYADQGKKVAQEVFDGNWTEKEKTFNEKTIPFVAGFASANAVVAAHWEKETGKAWTADQQKEFFELMSKEKVFDPFALEEKLLAPIRDSKKRETDIEAEVQKRLASRRGMPGGGNEDYIPQGNEPAGALQQALERSKGSDNFEDLIKSRSVEAAKALQTEGKV